VIGGVKRFLETGGPPMVSFVPFDNVSLRAYEQAAAGLC
jgi:hypothetical protein